MFLSGAWFWRGFQSAVFYYLSCAPCTKLAYRRRRRKEHKRAQAEKALNEAENGLYTHPLPFSTNPYWKEEIELGPGPPERRAVRDGKGKPEKPKSGKPGISRPLQTGGTGSSAATGVSSADTVVGSEGVEQIIDSGEGWNKKRYQREDEILWGLEDRETVSTGTASMSRSGTGSKYQFYARNPEINDLHPPVVSTHPTSRSEIQWMLQPPPKAKIMDGKERANTPNRSRSGTGGTNSSRGSIKKASELSLGKQVGERLMEPKLKNGEHLPSSVAMSRDPSARSTTSARSTLPQGQPHDRDTNTLSPSRSESLRRKMPPPSPISISSEILLPSPPPPRPPLSTIPSTSLSQKSKDRPHLRPLIVSANSVSSLHILQELVAPASQLNRTPSPVPDIARTVKLPPVSHQEDVDLRLPEVESWFPESGWGWSGSGKQGGEVRHAHRWSMDI